MGCYSRGQGMRSQFFPFHFQFQFQFQFLALLCDSFAPPRLKVKHLRLKLLRLEGSFTYL
jgi:hypothetical protein